MKRILWVPALVLIFYSCAEKGNDMVVPGERMTRFEQLEQVFHNPPAEYRTAPFWVWNNQVTREDIDRTLTEFKDKGIGGVFLHPRYGMITEYLSDEWWDLVSYSLQKAEELDLKLWLYDENSFPSGFAGGHVVARMPEANSDGVALQPHFMQVLRIPAELERVKHVFRKNGEVWEDITSDYHMDEGKTGEYCVLDLNDYERSKWFGGYSYVDLLKPGVTEKFMEITMPGYEKALGHEFGKRVPGVFTDEPNTNTRRAGPIRYTPDLYEQFEKQWGYRLEPHLMSLITETGDWKKIRHNYQSLILRLFIERWSIPWFNYTEEKNLSWTGHYWEHGWPNPKEGPDNMAMYAWHHMPGIDMLFNSETLRPDQFGNIRNVKELSSVANQFGRHRTLSETYGAAGWELTFDDMKRLGDWEYALGVNFMNQHLSYISLAGDRKHDFPQSFGTHAPYWGLYRYQADYFARLSAALSSGYQKNHILVIEPTTTAWMYYNPTSAENMQMNRVKQQFEPFLAKLEKFQAEYDLGSEDIIARHGKVEEGRFIINQAVYDMVILPPGLENLDRKTFDLLYAFVQAGGTVCQVETEPAFVDGSPWSFDDLKKQTSWHTHNSFASLESSGVLSGKKIQFENPGQVSGMVFHHRRELEDGQLLFLANFDKKETAEVEVSLEGKSLQIMDLPSGKITPGDFEHQKGFVRFNTVLPPSGSILVFASGKKGKSIAIPQPVRELMPAGPINAKAISPNILILDYVELSMGKYNDTPMYYYTAGNEIWRHHGYPDNPWVSSSQFKTDLTDADHFDDDSGFSVCYPFYTEEDYSGDSLLLVVERPWLYTVTINGKEIFPDSGRFWLDKEMQLFRLDSLVKHGRNEIMLKASPFSIYCELQPVWLLGDFSLNHAEKGWTVTRPEPMDTGSWKGQGMPFYGQTVAYSKEINIKIEGEYILHLPQWEGTVVEVLVGEEHKGIIQSPPYELRMFVPYGKQTLTVKITGSNKNTLGPHHMFKTPGVVTPGSFKNAPAEQPPGNAYDLLDYGLMSDFELYRLRN